MKISEQPPEYREQLENAQKDLFVYTRGTQILDEIRGHINAKKRISSGIGNFPGFAAAYFDALSTYSQARMPSEWIPSSIKFLLHNSHHPTRSELREICSPYRDYGNEPAVFDRDHAFHVDANRVATQALAYLEVGKISKAMHIVKNNEAACACDALAILIIECVQKQTENLSHVIAMCSKMNMLQARISSQKTFSAMLQLRAQTLLAVHLIAISQKRLWNYSTPIKKDLLENVLQLKMIQQHPDRFRTFISAFPFGEIMALTPLLSQKMQRVLEIFAETLAEFSRASKSELRVTPVMVEYPIHIPNQVETLRDLLNEMRDTVDTIDTKLFMRFGRRKVADITTVVLVDMKKPVTEREALEELSKLGLQPAGTTEIALLHLKYPHILIKGLHIIGLADRLEHSDRLSKETLVQWPCLSNDDDNGKRYFDFYDQMGEHFSDSEWRFVALPM